MISSIFFYTVINTIIKRTGKVVPFDVSRIKKVIEWACDGIDVNSLEFESKCHINIRNNMTTEQVQSVLISTALSMTNLDNYKNLNWRFVAARLQLLNMYKNAKRIQGYDNFGYGSYHDFLKLAISKGYYDFKILDEYSHEELLEMEQERNMEYDLGYDYAGMNLLRNRYLMKDDGRVFELPQDMYLTISLYLAMPEKKERRLEVAKKIYHAVASRKISLATPIVLNLRRVKGNLASCFIGAMDDDLNNIYYTLDQIAQISKNAGGVGINVSRVRCHGSYVKYQKGASGGVLPWVKLINDTAVAVDQLGSRSGAVTVALDVWHRDVEEFLEMQTENGDQRKKSFDIFPQLVVNDVFMSRVEENKMWTLFDPFEVRKKYGYELAELWGDKFKKVYHELEEDLELEFRKEISAKDIFKRFMKTVVETGMPYIFFKDTVNKMNPNKHLGFIGNANLCVESFSNFKPSVVEDKKLVGTKITQNIETGEVHTCNLVSLNLAEIETDELEYITSLGVQILDNTIEVSEAPIPEAAYHNKKYRILGVGCMGLSDYIVKHNMKYEDAEDLVDELFERIAYSGLKASNELAKSRGVYPAYEGSDWSKGILLSKDAEWFKENSKMSDKWLDLISDIKDHGMRNGGIFAIAPNTSTSLLSGVSASVLPIFKKFFVDKAANGAVPICPPLLDDKTFWLYKENQHIDQNHVINIISKIQKWTDQGISMELVLNLEKGVNAKYIYGLYMNAWKKGCKTVYYVRSITPNANNLKEDCVSCAN